MKSLREEIEEAAIAYDDSEVGNTYLGYKAGATEFVARTLLLVADFLQQDGVVEFRKLADEVREGGK